MILPSITITFLLITARIWDIVGMIAGKLEPPDSKDEGGFMFYRNATGLGITRLALEYKPGQIGGQ